MANPSAAYRDYPDSPRDPPNIDGGDAFELRSRDPRNRYSDALEPPDEEAQSEEERSFYGVRRAETPNSSAVRLRQFAVLAVIAMIFFMFAPEKSSRIDESSAEMHHEAKQSSNLFNPNPEPAGLQGEVSDVEPPKEVEVEDKEVNTTPDFSDVDFSEYCGECSWGMGKTCDGRVGWMKSKHGTPEDEGKAILLRAGQCGSEARKKYEEFKAHEIPLYPCRNSTDDEGGHGVDNFCGYCKWGNTQFDCFHRVKYLVDVYGDEELTAKQNLINQGMCTIPEDMKEQEAKLKEMGLEEWCGSCSWGNHVCDAKADWYAGDDPVLRVQKQKEIMEAGHCKKAPLCDDVNKEAANKGE